MKTLIENGNWQVAELELIYKTKVKPSERIRVSSSFQAYKVFEANWDFNKIDHIEQSKMIVLNNAHRILGLFELTSGGIDKNIMDPRMILVNALMLQGTAIIVAHNHPSGNLMPSDADIKATTRLKSACSLLDIKLLDHIIITSEHYTSLADDELLI
ncbi:JAB domain-containing protein [Pedobacter xixiisoli]|uniref:RadC-like JAB domain-containing protein n=1 Tax=Pedobacter xixiisoli TaxID=1476464 RepID=A0A286A724_9SPHI|nr:JAB domain-containing protein [Pedobacter xixiisoli]SOD17695.1 RadC-like JAB domain-containing protein [Pedobacter xixiisoli]